jgi:hypothetical protein
MARENMAQSNSNNGYGCLGWGLGILFFLVIVGAISESKKPELPIRVKCYVDKEYTGLFQVVYQWQNMIDFINDSDRDLRVDINIKNTGVRQSHDVYIIIRAHSVKRLSGLNGGEKYDWWYFDSNEEMELYHPEYRYKKIKLKFEKDKSFTY